MIKVKDLSVFMITTTPESVAYISVRVNILIKVIPTSRLITKSC
jgi:hypothetical protein